MPVHQQLPLEGEVLGGAQRCMMGHLTADQMAFQGRNAGEEEEMSVPARGPYCLGPAA